MGEISQRAEDVRLEDFAAISAKIDAGVPKDEVLTEAKLSPEAWESAKERWLVELAGQAALGRLAPGRRCAEIVVAERPRASAKARKARKKVSGELPEVPIAMISPLAGLDKELVVPTVIEIRREAEPETATAPMEPIVLPVSALPFVPAGDAPPRDAPPREPPKKKKWETMAVSIVQPAPALPFVQPGKPSKQAEQRMTMAMPAITGDDTVDGLGDATGPPAPSPIRAALPFAPSSAPAEPRPASRRDDGALPFHGPKPAASPAQPQEAAPASASEAMDRARAMSLRDYANLCAGVRAFPDRVAWIQSLFGLDAAAWGALHGAWRSRFDQDQKLKAEWAQLVSQGLPYWMQRRQGA